MFQIHSQFEPTGDQPQAINSLVRNIEAGVDRQTLIGVTGSGKTATMAWTIARINRPTLVISHNKTLASQLYQEFKEFFPGNAVHYFVSYYDYYQPEAYMPVTDTYIEKDAKINEFIDQLRHASTQSALTRRDVIIVASVSCIYGIGDPESYEKLSIDIHAGGKISRDALFGQLASLQYERNDYERRHGTFRVKGETVDIMSPDGEHITRIEFFGDTIERLQEGKTGIGHESFVSIEKKKIFPAKHFVTEQETLGTAITNIQTELAMRLKELKKEGKMLEAERLRQRTNFDIEMLEKTGYVNGIENYSRQLSFRNAGEPPYTLLDYLSDDTVIFIDESHMSVPQIGGMYKGDRSRKQTLVDYGFRLPSALDNRPLRFEEFEERVGQVIFVSATPGTYERETSTETTEQLIRPTGLLEPDIVVRPVRAQIEDAKKEIQKSVLQKERVLLVTLTKRLAEDITEYLLSHDIRAEYLHSEVKTLERSKILQRLREGEFDVLVGINLLREGLDLPEVALVLVLDADKEGFLRNRTSLIQTVGRAARHPKGRAILYGDTITRSMEATIQETARRREAQEAYNKKHGIVPHAITKPIRKPFWAEEKKKAPDMYLKEMYKELKTADAVKQELERQMLEAADSLQFEKAAELRDIWKTL
ncbi:MAG: excinuclease ABC subunit B [Candidatus Niyogibacteria bacterium CG10_big_fil_rev_8_21_14_0_10_46_36]|uniref:UvrABC system protein B n=1 Tax=Candidatus Niyogibacteria bacterium CG10_big_fil_rev_8_21_14_0_10_46_36 TaxID=1974726 RepID=A0A2H0TDI2_9BACT|nr:MAG: excinuclease ABC subunit B [Candidatus Niyogibacteria bacterium CG10_big_fil_rev_8_21_14_0_10_46_36]